MARKNTAADRIDAEAGMRLASARKAKKMTQQQMADHFGMTKQAWQYYEKGREMKAGMIKEVCAILECSPSWLLGMTERGRQLPPESPLMVALKESLSKLNDKGQRKVAAYADDLTGNSEYVVRAKSTLQDSEVRGAA